jgi:L-alanine-DL-glutamate epimerase-like enolase superfamily enzyme
VKITRVHSDAYQVPVHREMHDAVRDFNRLDLVMARVETSEGASGQGFTYSVFKHGAREISSFVNHSIDEIVRGMDPRHHEAVWSRVFRASDWVARGGIVMLAMAALDIALWDLKSKLAGMPLFQLLGGSRTRVPVYNTDGGWLNHSVEQLVEETRQIVAAGFRGTKIKVGKEDPVEDRERIAAVRAVLGPHRRLMVDANECFTHAEAVRRARSWEEFDLFWFEEPLPIDDIAGHAQLKAHTSIPIAAGENLHTRGQFRDYIAANAVSIAQPDACRCGGITEWLKIAHLAETHHLPVSPHFVMELHLPLVAAIPNGLWVEYIPAMNNILSAPLKLEDGHFIPSQEPGLGIPWDEEKLARFRAT